MVQVQNDRCGEHELYTPRVIHRQPSQWTIRITAPKRKEPTPPASLQMFIVRNGGLDPFYANRKWAHECRMIRDGGPKGLMPGVFNHSATLTFEEMAERCCEAGYLTEADVDELFFGLAKDVEATHCGERRHRVYGHSGEDYAVNLAYERWVDNQEEEAA